MERTEAACLEMTVRVRLPSQRNIALKRLNDKKKMENPNLSTKCVIGKARASYVHVFRPSSISVDGSDPKYSISLIIPKSDTALVEKIKSCIKAAYEAGLASKWGNKAPKPWKNPLRDGDEERSDKPEYVDCYFINASCKTKPGVCKKTGTKMVEGKKKNIIVDIADEEELYSGCWVFAAVNFYAFNSNGNKGIACGLNNVLKAEDGEMLGGRTSSESDFGDMEIPDDIDGDPFGPAPTDDCPYL